MVTTYEGLRLNQDLLLPVDWAYAILDEGHRIRNPDAGITLVCKRLNVCFAVNAINASNLLTLTLRPTTVSFLLALQSKITSLNCGHCMTSFSQAS